MKKKGITSKPKMTAIDLFSGCGGLSQGLKDVGFNILAAVELDANAAETYKLNHKKVSLYNQDIKEIQASELLKTLGLKKGELDLLAGCPPCQGFSRLINNNKPKKLSDARNRLIDEVARLVIGLYPKVIMIENVPNLIKYTRYKDFKKTLKRLGYNISDEVLNVADFGVPQRRRRLVLLASRIGPIAHLSPTGIRKTVRQAISGLPPITKSLDPLHISSNVRSDRITQLIKNIPKDGGSRSSLPKELALKCHEGRDGYYDVYGRMKWDDVAPTITGGCINPSKGRFLHPIEDRAITLREAALLQTFPAQYKFSLARGKYAVAEMIGNALPPAFSMAQASVIKNHLIEYYE